MRVWIIFCVQFLCAISMLNAETLHDQSPDQNSFPVDLNAVKARIPPLVAYVSQPDAFMRAAYFHLTDPEKAQAWLQRLSRHGLNAILVADPSYQPKEDLWQAWGRMAGKYDLQLFPVLNFAVPREFRDMQAHYRPYVDRAGTVYQATPCPLDESYWNTVIGERFKFFAKLFSTVPHAGVTFDSEMYGSEMSLYDDLCYCDSCWQQFINSEWAFRPSKTGIYQDASDLPKEARFDYLRKHYLLRRYTIFQWQRVYEILSHIEQQVHRINPDLQLGFLGYLHGWFFTALVQGLGTTDNPVLVFSESSYIRGYTPYVDQERDNVVGKMNVARYIPGLWLDRFFPQDLPSQLTDLAINTDGYWIYPVDRLWRDKPKSNQTALHGNTKAYWEGIKHANAELLRRSRFFDFTERMVPPVLQASFYNLQQNRLFTTPALKQMLTHVVATHRPEFSAKHSYNVDPITYRGQTLFHCLTQGEGSLQITHVPVGKDTDPEIFQSSKDRTFPISYTLFDDQGQVLQEGRVGPPERSKRIILPVNAGKIVSLLIKSGMNGAQLQVSGLSCVIEASSTFPLETFKAAQEYLLYVAPGQERLKFKAHCPPQESASIIIQSPNRLFSQSVDIVGYTEFQIEQTAAPDQTFWIITIAPVPSTAFADLRFYLYDEKSPYLIPMFQ